MTVTIREARKTPEDVDAIVAMTHALHAHHAACDDRSRHVHDGTATRAEVLEILDVPESRTLFAVDDDGRVVGMAIGKIREHPGHVPPASGYIQRVFVDESQRGRGVARQLLREPLTFFGEDVINGEKVYVLEGKVNDDSLRDHPKAQDLKRLWPTIKIWISQGDLFPRRYTTFGPDGQQNQTAEFTNVKMNVPVDETLFTYTPPEGATIADRTKEDAPAEDQGPHHLPAFCWTTPLS